MPCLWTKPARLGISSASLKRISSSRMDGWRSSSPDMESWLTLSPMLPNCLPILEIYDPEEGYNFDETNLYHKPLDDRVILGLCANMSGHDRLKMIFLHTVARPRCFPTAFDPNMLVHFYAWMNGDVFTSWVCGEIKRMASSNRRISHIIG